MTRHNKRSFILAISGLETNYDPRASAEIVWDECQKVNQQERSSANWLEVRYESLVASPKETIEELYCKLGLGRPDERILSIIRPRKQPKPSAPSRKPWWAIRSAFRRLGSARVPV